MRTFHTLLVVLLAFGCGDNDAPPDRIDQPPIDAAVITGDGAVADAAPGTVDAAVATIDSGLPVPEVACGATTCDPLTQDCCVTPNPGAEPTFTCQSTGTACTGSLVSCDGPEDCAGDICCARTSPMSYESTCGATCNGGNANVVCHLDTDCEAGEVCCDDPMGFRACVTGAACP